MPNDDQKHNPSETSSVVTPSVGEPKPASPAPTDPHDHQEVFPYHRVFVLAIDALLILAVGILVFLYIFARPGALIEQPIVPSIPVDEPTVPDQIVPTDPVIVPSEEITITPEQPRCVKTGCSGQICSDREMASTCEFEPSYRCYVTARCERQADGACGWTQTPELQSCLLNPPTIE